MIIAFLPQEWNESYTGEVDIILRYRESRHPTCIKKESSWVAPNYGTVEYGISQGAWSIEIRAYYGLSADEA